MIAEQENVGPPVSQTPSFFQRPVYNRLLINPDYKYRNNLKYFYIRPPSWEKCCNNMLKPLFSLKCDVWSALEFSGSVRTRSRTRPSVSNRNWTRKSLQYLKWPLKAGWKQVPIGSCLTLHQYHVQFFESLFMTTVGWCGWHNLWYHPQHFTIINWIYSTNQQLVDSPMEQPNFK